MLKQIILLTTLLISSQSMLTIQHQKGGQNPAVPKKGGSGGGGNYHPTPTPTNTSASKLFISTTSSFNGHVGQIVSNQRFLDSLYLNRRQQLADAQIAAYGAEQLYLQQLNSINHGKTDIKGYEAKPSNPAYGTPVSYSIGTVVSNDLPLLTEPSCPPSPTRAELRQKEMVAWATERAKGCKPDSQEATTRDKIIAQGIESFLEDGQDAAIEYAKKEKVRQRIETEQRIQKSYSDYADACAEVNRHNEARGFCAIQ